MRGKKIAFYLRLSLSDGDLGEDRKEESNSIENQRALLEQYCEEREDIVGEVEEYIDDGYTGTNFDRPGFQRMIEDAKQGQIRMVIVKDLSRLGRDYIEVGDYVEQIFPILGIRFISINDNLDSNKSDGTMALEQAVSNLINTLYSRDLSKKRRSSLLTQWKNGRASAFRAPFGYKMDPKQVGHLLIDPEAAGYIRKVFDYALQGLNTAEIATKMNEEHIPTPVIYAKTHKQGGQIRTVAPDSEQLWTYTKIWKILNMEEYTGILVMGRRSTVKVGSKVRRKNPEFEWYRIEGTHEAIVSKEEYEVAQCVIRNISKRRYVTEQQFTLRGKLRCGNCNRLMAYTERAHDATYHCANKVSAGKYSKCSDEKYIAGEIDAQVHYAIKNMIQLAAYLLETLEKRAVSKQARTPEQITDKIERLKAERIRQYESYADGVISREVYLRAKQETAEQIEALEREFETLTAANKREEEIYRGLRKLTLLGMPYKDAEKLTKEEVEAFIDQVFIYSSSRIEIVFTAEDVLEKAVNLCGLEVKAE